jgi:Lrp/AsnC family transcriptional regulator, leucine-responsive regulatory protein
VIDALRRIPEIVRCDVMSGEFDLVLRIEADETDRIRRIWEEIAAMDGVRDTLTAFVLSSLIDRDRRRARGVLEDHACLDGA